jgi:hypothetical protein
MATDIVQSLFGVSPEMYQRQQDALLEARALKFAEMDPMQQATYGIYRGAGQLGGALGRALGGEDPELARISMRQQVARGLDINDPTSIEQGVRSLQQSGDIQGAMMLMQTADEAAKRQLARTEQAEKTRQIGLTNLAERIAAGAYQPPVAQLDDFGNVMPGVAPTPASYDVSRVQPQLMALGTAGIAKLKQLQEAQALTQPKYEKAGEVWYKITPGQPPEPIGGVFKKGEKIATRNASGNWEYVTPTGATAPVAASDNPISAMIQGNALHSTLLPYANQLSRNFLTMDPEDQDKAMEKLTRLNSDAVYKEATLQGRQDAAATRAGQAALTQALLELRIEDARRKSDAAADGRPITIADSTKLAERALSADKLVNIYESFKPEFAGFATDRVGDAALLIAGKSKDPKSVELFQWWQGYQENINKVRNELFGAALTAPEKAEFEKAMVTKGMSPQQAASNLKRQAELAVNAYNKLDNVLRVQGFSKSGLNALKPTGLRPGLESFVVPAPPAAGAAPK